jgi:hypothetical protein
VPHKFFSQWVVSKYVSTSGCHFGWDACTLFMNEHNPRTDTPFASIVHLRWEKNFHFLFVRHYPGRGELENGSFHSYGSEISHGTCIGNSKKSRMELALEIQRNLAWNLHWKFKEIAQLIFYEIPV